MKHAFALFAFILLALGQLAAKADPFLIVPGRSIGQTHLGRDGDKIVKRLPSPTIFEHHMMQSNLVWVSRPTAGHRQETLYLHRVNNGVLDPPGPGEAVSGEAVDAIRVTSPQFRTRGGIGSGSLLRQILRRFPHSQPVDGDRTVYADSVRGIAFEFRRKAIADARCIAVTVFPVGDVRIINAAQVRDLLRSGELH